MGFQKELIMSWKKEIDELKKREKLSEEMGGAEKLKKQKIINFLLLLVYKKSFVLEPLLQQLKN